jgi:hypothetical protein
MAARLRSVECQPDRDERVVRIRVLRARLVVRIAVVAGG